MYHSQNGFMINPSDSNYVPTATNNVVIRTQMRASEGQAFIPGGSVGQGGFRSSHNVQIPRGL